MDGQNGRKRAAKARGFEPSSPNARLQARPALAPGSPLTHKGREPGLAGMVDRNDRARSDWEGGVAKAAIDGCIRKGTAARFSPAQYEHSCAPAGAVPLSRGNADRQSRRHHAESPRDACRGRCARLRGHEGDAGAFGPLRHRQSAHRLSRAQCRRGGAATACSTWQWEIGGARLRCRYAARLRSGLSPGAAAVEAATGSFPYLAPRRRLRPSSAPAFRAMPSSSQAFCR